MFAALSHATPSVAVDADGLRLYVSTHDQGVSASVFASGIYESELFAQVTGEMARHDLPSLAGRSFLDIGANIGTATCLALTRYGAARAWAFEPSPANVELLRLNVLANGLERRVVIAPHALSDESGTAPFEISATNWGDHRVRVAVGTPPYARNDEERRAVIQVTKQRFDDLVVEGTLDLNDIGLVWLDVQGHEAHVLRGADTLLATEIPIVCEYWPYGLERAGTLEEFPELVGRHRSEFIDLSAADARGQPISRIATLAARYPRTFTNLLVLR